MLPTNHKVYHRYPDRQKSAGRADRKSGRCWYYITVARNKTRQTDRQCNSGNRELRLECMARLWTSTYQPDLPGQTNKQVYLPYGPKTEQGL